jgi:phospholipid-binding lipoprotein MlaA
MRSWVRIGGAAALAAAIAWGAEARADQAPLKSEVVEDAQLESSREPWDPLEGFNRAMFWFNDRLLDRWVVGPVSEGWDWVAPDPVQRSISRFFDHTTLPLVMVHNVLQGKPKAAAQDFGRLLANTFLGGVGFLDPASDWGLPDHDEDAGQTLAVWGVPMGPYVVVPFWGSTSFRDGTGQLIDNAWVWFTPGFYTTAARVVWAVNDRSLVTREVEEARAASLDFYSAVRHAYGERRARLVADAEDTSVSNAEDLYFPEAVE